MIRSERAAGCIQMPQKRPFERQANPIMNDDPVVSTTWLAARLGDPKLRIVDASFKMPGVSPTAAQDYAAAHIPGAIFFDIDAIADRTSSLPHMFPDAGQFAHNLGTLGIGDNHGIIIYDAGNWMGAPRAWWTFRLFGRNDVKLLDGGLTAWRAAGGALTAEPSWVAPSHFTARYEAARVRDKAQLLDNLRSRAEQVVDARTPERFRGEVAEPWPGRRSGRIPQSLNVPFAALSDAATGAMKSPDELRRIFQSAGVDASRPIVTSCGSGVTAAALNLALHRIGITETALYDGSWAEWGLPDGPALEKD
jgi:thiosulfate/3-mercaptopyruvate sulfurtransferase